MNWTTVAKQKMPAPQEKKPTKTKKVTHKTWIFKNQFWGN